MQLLPFSKAEHDVLEFSKAERDVHEKAERDVHEIVGAVETGDATPLEIKG